MSDSTNDRHVVEVLASEFAARLREGKAAHIEEYVEQHPQHEQAIRELFPTIEALERMRTRQTPKDAHRSARSTMKLERLGDLRLIREVGRGGMGVVYLAEQESLGRQVAVKVLPQQALFDSKQLRRFQREAKTAARLHHTNIVPILGVGEHDGTHYYVMQFIDGVGLDQIIGGLRQHGIRVEGSWHLSAASTQQQAHRLAVDAGTADTVVSAQTEAEFDSAVQPATLTAVPEAMQSKGTYWREVAHLGFQVAQALGYAHEHGTLHRDIKPSNLILDQEKTVWVADFGLAKAAEQDAVSRTGDIVGTLRYMAPEQLRGEADPRSDIYGLGLTLYELLTLQPAHDDATRKQALVQGRPARPPAAPRKLNAHIPRDLETIVLRCLHEEPANRYKSAWLVADDLQRFLEDRPIAARRADWWERSYRWARRNPAVASLTAFAVFLLALVAVVASIGFARTNWALNRESTQRQRAEQTLGLALEALDSIYERFVPERLWEASQVALAASDLDEAEQAELQLPTQVAISPETARLLEELLTVYDRLADLDQGDVQLRSEAAKANRRVGDIHQRLRQFEQAETAYKQAIARYAALVRENGSRLAWTTELARLHNELGSVYRETFQFDQAFDSHDTALASLRAEVKSSDEPELRYELARTLFLIAKRPTPTPMGPGMSRGGRFPGEGFGGGRSGRGGPDVGGGGRGRGGPDLGRGGPDFGGGGIRGPGRGRPDFDRGGIDRGGFGRGGYGRGPGRPLAVGDNGVTRYGPVELPPSPAEQTLLVGDGRFGPPQGPGRGFGRGGERWMKDRRPPWEGPDGPEGSDSRWRSQQLRDVSLDEAINLLSELTAEQPEVPEYRRLLAVCHLERSRNPEGEGFDTAVQILEALVREFPDVDDYRYELSETLASIDRRRMFTADVNAIVEQLRQAAKIARPLDSQVPAFLVVRTQIDHKLSMSLRRLAMQSASPERDRYLTEAAMLARSALNRQTQLADNYPESEPYRAWRASLRLSMADLLLERGREEDRDEATGLLTAAAADIADVDDDSPSGMFGYMLSREIERKMRYAQRVEGDNGAGPPRGNRGRGRGAREGTGAQEGRGGS